MASAAFFTYVFVRPSLTDGRLALDGGGPDRERKLDGLDDPLEEQLSLRRAELLRVLLGVGQDAQLVLELLAHRLEHRLQAAPLENGVEARPHLRLADDVLFGGVDRDRRAELGDDLLDGGAGLAQAVGARCAEEMRSPWLASSSSVSSESSHFGLPTRRRSSSCSLAELLDLRVREVEGLEELVLGHLVRAGLDHRQAFLRPDDDQVELGGLDVGERRVDDELAVEHADPDGAHGAEERQRRDHQRRRGAVDRRGCRAG